MEDTAMEDSEHNNNIETEVAPALISLHPSQQSVAVAVGSDLRVFNLQYIYIYLIVLLVL